MIERSDFLEITKQELKLLAQQYDYQETTPRSYEIQYVKGSYFITISYDYRYWGEVDIFIGERASHAQFDLGTVLNTCNCDHATIMRITDVKCDNRERYRKSIAEVASALQAYCEPFLKGDMQVYDATHDEQRRRAQRYTEQFEEKHINGAEKRPINERETDK